MEFLVIGLLIALVVAARVWDHPGKLATIQEELSRHQAKYHQLQAELQNTRDQVATLREQFLDLLAFVATPAEADAAPTPAAATSTWEPQFAPAAVAPPVPSPPVEPTPPSAAPAPFIAEPATSPTTVETAEPTPTPAEEPAIAVEPEPTSELMPEPVLIIEPELPTDLVTEPTAEPEIVAETVETEPIAELAETEEAEVALTPLAESELLVEASETPLAAEPAAEPDSEPIVEPKPTTDSEPLTEPTSTPTNEPTPADEPAPTRKPQPQPARRPTPPPARKPVSPRLKPVPTGPTWWERAATVLLENWTGILGAMVLVTGVGFLGIYAALRLAPPYRFLMICAFAGSLLGVRFGLRDKAFAKKLNAWLLSSAAAIFLFACVGAVSIPGLRWATPPFDYLLLLAGVFANLYLAWRTSREEVATLHGVLSLVALAVLPPTALTLGAAAGVTAFSIAITYRQRWKYQLLLSIASFFAFHLYWHQELAVISNSLRLTAMALVVLVGGAAAVVQYRSVYAQRKFEPLLFTAHLLNWTCLGINLYLYSTGSVWKTIPLALGALGTFWAGRRAKQLGIGWLFQTDTIISLILALATALSLQGWHATPTVIGLFMLLEALLITLIMARQREALVFRVALLTALLASAGLLGLAGLHWADSLPPLLYREALVLALAGWAGLAFIQLILKQPLLQIGSLGIDKETTSEKYNQYQSHHDLLNVFAGLTGLLQLGAGLGLARILFGWSAAPVAALLLGLAGVGLALAAWVRAAGRASSWVRWQQVVLAQLFVVGAMLGLHEAGLNWSAILLLLYAESLAASLLLAGRAAPDLLHQQVYRAALAAAALVGTVVLLRALSYVAGGTPAVLYREAAVLTLAGLLTLSFVQVAFKYPLLAGIKPYLPRHQRTTATATFSLPLVSNHEAHLRWLGGFAGLGGGLQVGVGVVLGRLLFGVPEAPITLLLTGLLALAGLSLGLATWVRTAGRVPSWVRWQQLVLAQFFGLLALVGLHKLGLNWSVVLLLVFAETLLVALLLAGRAASDWLHQLLYRVALAEAALVGVGILLRALSYWSTGAGTATLYREALVVALAGWAGLAFAQVAFKWPLLAGVKPYLPRLITGGIATITPLVSNPTENRRLVNGFAGLSGGLQVVVGLLLSHLLFGGLAAVSVGWLLGLLVALAGSALGLATWVRRAGQLPGWARWQQLVLSQFFVVLALLGLHELGLNWSVVLLLLYLETLSVALLLAGRAAHDFLHQQLYRVALAEAALVGLGVLLRALSHLASGAPTVLYREALVVALAGWASLAFGQFTFKWPLFAGVKPYLPRFSSAAEAWLTELVSSPEENRGLVNGLVGFGGGLQAVVGILLGRMLFGWAGVSVGLLIGLLMALAGSALGLAAWVRTASRLPGWARWQQLGLAQLFVVLALVGLHEVGLGWSSVLLLVFVENLLVALLLAGRAEFDELHAQVYRAVLVGAWCMGGSLLLLVGSHLASGGLVLLSREALVLALAGWAALAFGQLALKWPMLRSVRTYLPGYAADGIPPSHLVSNHEANRDWLGSFAGLAGGLQAGVGLVLARLLFGWAGAPVALLVALLVALAAITLGLAIWLRSSNLTPRWVQRQQLVLAQLFAVLAIFGLHELGLSWPGIVGIVYAENLVVALLLGGRDEDNLLHIQTYFLVVQALALPLLVRYASPSALGPLGRAVLLMGAALLTLGYQARRLYWRRAQQDVARLALGTPLPVLGLAVGWLLLGAGSLVYEQLWAAWVLVALLSSLLYLRQRVALPGLWAGLMAAGVGYVALQWSHVLHPLAVGLPHYQAGYVLLYLLPTLAVPTAGLLTSWWPARERYVRWPWLYLLGAHLVVALAAAVTAGHLAYLMLGLLALSGAAFGAALAWRRALPTADAVVRAGRPDRYLLHLSYGGLLGSLLVHIWLLTHYETLFGLRADYLTAGLFAGVVAALALARQPATAPVYASWRQLHPWLPEIVLLFGSLTLAHDVRAQWLPLVWVGTALLLGAAAPRLALRFRRLGVYGRLYYWLAAFMASFECVLHTTPGQLLSAEWWALAAAVGLLFGYVGLALRQGQAPFAGLAPAWQALALPGRYQLEACLLYPAFLALALLLIQSFDRSVLTVLLMLQVVAVFGASLLLRRQDFRYVSLAGMLGCMARLLFFDLRQSGTVTRAIVFIFMGLLLLGMNALYARFKDRFADPDAPEEADDLDETEAADEPQPSLP
jgi:hypothetical protein